MMVLLEELIAASGGGVDKRIRIIMLPTHHQPSAYNEIRKTVRRAVQQQCHQ
jgi:hypothetical protein